MRNRKTEHDVNINIRISSELRENLNRVAEKNNLKSSELIREFIRRLEE